MAHDGNEEYNGEMPTIHETPVLERLLQPVSDSLNADAAQRLIALKADPELQAKVDELAEKCNEGLLTAEERAEYDSYIAAGSLIAILKARARLLLARESR